MLALKNKIFSYNRNVPEEDFKYLFQFYKQHRLKKGDLLNKAGDLVNTLYFMQKGCVLLYAEIDGQETVIEFFTENDIFTDYYSYLKELPSQSNLRAMENCVVLGVKKADFEEVLKKSHALERFGRKFLEEQHLEVIINFQNNAVLSNEERY